MMTQLKSEQDEFQASLACHYEQMIANFSLQEFRKKGWKRFQEIGLPTRKHELFRYVKLHYLYSQQYQLAQASEIQAADVALHVIPECQESVLVFVNGIFRADLSCTAALPQKAVVQPFSVAMRTYGALLTNQLTKAIKEETDPFAALNIALHRDALFLYLPPKTVLDVPIQLLYLVDAGKDKLMVSPRFQLFAGAHSEIEVIASHAALSGAGYCINQTAQFSLEENSKVHYTQVNCEAPDNIWHFDALRASLKRDSFLKVVNATTGSATIRNDYRVMLLGENCHTSLNGISMLGQKREAHTHVYVDHQAPNCESRQLYKSVLNDASHSCFEGKIMVRQAAQKTNAFQLNNNLLLSDQASAESKPNLEIFADDVKASHGATVGQLDKEELFYMKSRGFSDIEAKGLLIFGFCKEIIDMLPVNSLRQKIKEKAQRYLIGE